MAPDGLPIVQAASHAVDATTSVNVDISIKPGNTSSTSVNATAAQPKPLQITGTALPRYDEAGKYGEFTALGGKIQKGMEPQKATATLSTAEAPRKSHAASSKVGALTSMRFVAKDKSYNGNIRSASMNLIKDTSANATDADYIMLNVFGLGDSIRMNINLAGGKVTIPAQVMMYHSTYGDVKMLPMTFEYDANGNVIKMIYYETGNINGTIDEKGTIRLEGWGLLFGSDRYQGYGYDFMTGSEWKASNLIATGTRCITEGTNVSTQPLEYAIDIEQPGSSTATLYCLSGAHGEILQARVNSDSTISIAPQEVFINTKNGPYYIYRAYTSEDGKRYVDLQGFITGRIKGNEIEFGDWIVAARTSPTQYVGYDMRGMKVNGNPGLKFPAAATQTFTGAGSEASPYIIKDYTDLHSLAMLVAAGETYKDKYFTLASDLDLKGVAKGDYRPVGDLTNNFQGTFDGANHTISNLTIDGMGFNDAGIFGIVGQFGTVKNLKIDKADIRNVGSTLGFIAGCSYGKIENCHITNSTGYSEGDLLGGIIGMGTEVKISDDQWMLSYITNCTVSNTKLTGFGAVGGIAGQARANIENCHFSGNLVQNGYLSNTVCDLGGIAGALNRGNITSCSVTGFITDSYGMCKTGGIAGRLIAGNISKSFNTAFISTTRDSAEDDTETGGIAGYGIEGSISDCFNAGTVVKNKSSENVGGIIGYIGYPMADGNAATRVSNCLNYGQVLVPNSNEKRGLFGTTYKAMTGQTSSEEACISNCYYDGQIQLYRESKYGRKTAQLTAAVPEGFSSEIWQITPGNYPVLKQFADRAASQFGATPLVLRGNDDATKVKVSFSHPENKGMAWGIFVNDNAVSETPELSYANNIFTIKEKYATVNIVGLSLDGNSGKMYQLSLVPKAFEGEGTPEAPYLIKTVNDWKTLHNAVCSGQRHAGDYFSMTNDIDFNYTNEFNGVGYGKSYTVSFGGTFDGGNHKISKLKINTVESEISYTGLFGFIDPDGTVKNVIINDDCDFKVCTVAGPIAGATLGRIDNCKNYANIDASFTDIGGIVGIAGNGSYVSRCYNAGRIRSGAIIMGGIAGYMPSGSVVADCQNDGDVLSVPVFPGDEGTKKTTAGGITGYSYGQILRCVNNGTVSANSIVGGIAAALSLYESPDAKIVDCVNNGFVDFRTPTTDRGGIVGVCANPEVVKGNIYDCSINVNGSIENNSNADNKGYSTTEMVSGKEMGCITADFYDLAAGKYPVLKVYANEALTKQLRQLYVKFAPEHIRTNVTGDVELSNAEGSKFELKVKENFKIYDGKLTVTPPTGMTLAEDTITATYGKAVKQFALGAIPAIFKGEGTTESPYLLETPADWNKLADFMFASKWEFPGNHFVLTGDLDFKGDSIRALAVQGTILQAEIDGKSHAVKGFKYQNINNKTNSIQGPNLYLGRLIGLVGSLGSTGVLRNLTFDGEFTAYEQSAGIVGNMSGTIDNVINKMTIRSTNGNNMAGFAYTMNPGALIKNSRFAGHVESKTTNVMGFAYNILDNAVIDNCVNEGEVWSGTSGAFGFAYNCKGLIKNSVNKANFKSVAGNTGTCAGFVNTISDAGSMENCSNQVDIDYSGKGGSIYGLFATISAKSTGHITNCYNIGNIFGKTGVYGLGNSVGAGIYIADCYNTGVVFADAKSGYAAGLFNQVTGTASGHDRNTIIERVYNTGFVYGQYGSTAGIARSISSGTILRDSYNAGDVISENHTSLNSGGITGSLLSSVMERCFNLGNVSSTGNCVGGLMGYASRSTADCIIKDCYNLGDVESKYTGTNKNGNAGGLAGYFSMGQIQVMNCYNMGNVKSRTRVGGISGGISRPLTEVTNVFNTGKVICTYTEDVTIDGKTEKRALWSGTIFSDTPDYNGESYFINSRAVYYDKTVNPGEQFLDFPGSGKTTSEMAVLELGDSFVTNPNGGYPALKFFADSFKVENIAHAMVALTVANDDFDNVTGAITLIAPEGAVWTAIDPETGAPSNALVIKGNTATPQADAMVKLVVADSKKMQSKSFMLNLKPSASGIDDTFAGKTVDSITYFDLNGRKIANPSAGNVYVARTIYTDGSMQINKILIKD